MADGGGTGGSGIVEDETKRAQPFQSRTRDGDARIRRGMTRRATPPPPLALEGVEARAEVVK